MRKSLLMTSALGLILPTLAMAGTATVGSGGVACHSGFFAQLDAKIMNAKLTIKNEKKKTPENSEKEADVEANLIAAQEAALAKMEILFEGLPAAQIQKLRAAVAAGGLNITRLLNATTDRQIEVIVLHALKGAADDLASMVPDVAGGGVVALLAPTAAQLDAVTDAMIDAALAAGGRTVIAANTLAVSVAGVLTRPQFNKAVADAKRLKKAIEADTVRATEFKGAGVPTNIGDILALSSNVFARKTILSTQAENDGVINIGGSSNYNLVDFDNIFVIAGSAMGATGVANDFAAAKGVFLNGDAAAAGVAAPVPYKTTRANSLKNVAWFADSVKQRKERIADKNAAIAKDNVNFDRRVHHHALAGGVGGTVGWWQNLGGFALSVSGGADYLWGTFRTVDDASGSTVKAEDKKKLGFGLQGDVGVHYVVSPSTTLGVLIGLRGQQLNFGRKDKGTTATTASSKDSKGDYASKWMINPVVSLQARTFFTDAVYGALTVGYVIPLSDKDFKLDNTKIDKDAKINFQGLTGAFSVGMMF